MVGSNYGRQQLPNLTIATFSAKISAKFSVKISATFSVKI